MAYVNYQNQNQQYYPNNYQNQNQYLNSSSYLQNQNYNVPGNQMINNSIIWVQGEAEAKNYLVAPNTTIPLWDTEEHKIYLKSADSAGMPTIKILEYTIREKNSNPLIAESEKSASNVEYVKIEEFKKLQEEMESFKAEFLEKTNNNYRKRGKNSK